MKILARQLTVDMYDCKNKDLSNYEDLRESLDMAMNMAGYTPIEVRAQLWNEEQAIVFILLQEGHAVVRTYPNSVYTISAPNFLHIRRKAGSVTSSIGARKIGYLPRSIFLIFIVVCLSLGYRKVRFI